MKKIKKILIKNKTNLIINNPLKIIVKINKKASLTKMIKKKMTKIILIIKILMIKEKNHFLQKEVKILIMIVKYD